MSKECVFCRIVAGEEPLNHVAEDERALAFMDINPATVGHSLVIPKAHAVDIWELEPEDAGAVWRLAIRVAQAQREALKPEGLTLFQANGRAGFQDVFHFHLHLVPRWRGDGLKKSWVSSPGDPTKIAANAERIRSRLV